MRAQRQNTFKPHTDQSSLDFSSDDFAAEIILNSANNDNSHGRHSGLWLGAILAFALIVEIIIISNPPRCSAGQNSSTRFTIGSAILLAGC
jgi:hypothetical protein